MSLKGANSKNQAGFIDKEKKKVEKKNLTFIDYSKHDYEPIRKNLYIESKEITMWSDKEVN